MDIVTFNKKLLFTIESVEKNNGHVTGIVELDNGTCVYFDDYGISVKNKDGGTLWATEFCDDHDDDYKRRVRDLIIDGISSKRVVRVYPDCC